MMRRNDGLGIRFKSPVYSFTTGERPYVWPGVFEKWKGAYSVKDTQLIAHIDYPNGPSGPAVHTQEYRPNGQKTITLVYLVQEKVYVYGPDTIRYLSLELPSGAYKVRMTTRGEFYYSQSLYPGARIVSGQIIGDSIACGDIRTNNYAPTANGNSYRGKKL